MKHPNKQKGFTLIELIAVIVIVGIITSGSAHLLAQGFRSYEEAQKILHASGQTNVALQRMTRDLRAIRSSGDIDNTTNNTSITFTDVDANEITYSYNNLSSTIEYNNITLADKIDSLTFEYYDNTSTIIDDPSTDKSDIRYIIIKIINSVILKSQQPVGTVYLWNIK